MKFKPAYLLLIAIALSSVGSNPSLGAKSEKGNDHYGGSVILIEDQKPFNVQLTAPAMILTSCDVMDFDCLATITIAIPVTEGNVYCGAATSNANHSPEKPFNQPFDYGPAFYQVNSNPNKITGSILSPTKSEINFCQDPGAGYYIRSAELVNKSSGKFNPLRC